MGQVMLESCEMQCQKMGPDSKIKNKSQIYFNNMGAQLPEFTHGDSQDLMKSKASLMRNNEFLIELKTVPSHYVEFANYLFVEKKKFEDRIFPANANSIIWGAGQAENDWARLSDMSEEIARIYKGIGHFGKTKSIEILQVMEENFAGCLEMIKPIYVSKVGLAICYLYINGNRQEVVVDDLIPTSHLRYFTQANKWHFLVEKAIAKLLGSYALVEQFSLPELFQEITGLPFEISKKKGEEWLNRDSSVKLHDLKINSFKDVIEDEKVYYLQGGYENSDVYNVRIIRGHTIRSMPFHSGPHLISLYKIQLQSAQKLSIRISFLNPKYQNSPQGQMFSSSEMKLYREDNGGFTTAERDTSNLGNNLYLGCPYLQLERGEYLLFVKREQVSIRATLVCYVGEGFKIKEIHSKQICKELLGKLKRPQKI